MSCYNHASAPFAVLPTKDQSRRDHLALRRLIVALIEAFYEALEMRRVAYRRYHLSSE
jgi:hypothetical protein